MNDERRDLRKVSGAVVAGGLAGCSGLVDRDDGAADDEDDPRGAVTMDEASHRATTGAVIGETTSDADVPYDAVGMTNTRTYPLDRERATALLSSSDLPPGL